MSYDIFLNDKLKQIILNQYYISRVNFIDVINETINKSIAYITAPSGYGKTTAVLLLLKEKDKNSLWFNLDKYDNCLASFYKLFCTALLSTQKENEFILNILNSDDFANFPVENTIKIISEIYFKNGEIVLVLDNFHNINDPLIIESIPFIVKRLPNTYKIIVLSRMNIKNEFMPSVENGKISLFNLDLLRFSENEIISYFNKYELNITKDKCSSVHKQTNGWAEGIYFIFKSQLVAGVNYKEYIYQLIYKKWSMLDDFLKAALIKLSLFENFDLNFAKAIIEDEQYEKILFVLSNENPFLYINDIGEYNFFGLMKEFISTYIIDNNLLCENEIFKKAADYYFSINNHFKARHFSLKCSYFKLIVDSMLSFTNHTNKNASIENYAAFSQEFFSENIPLAVYKEYPFIYATKAWHHCISGEAEQTEEYLDELHKHLNFIKDKYCELYEVCLLICSIDYRINIIDIMKLASTYSQTNKKETLSGISFIINLPMFHRSIRDFIDLSIENNIDKFILSYSSLLKGNTDLIKYALKASFLYEKNKSEDALRYALMAINYINEKTVSEFKFPCYIMLSSIYYSMRNYEGYFTTLNLIEEMIKIDEAVYLNNNFYAFKSSQLFLDGDLECAKEYLEKIENKSEEQLKLYKIYQYFVTVRAKIIVGELDEALNLTKRVLQLSLDYKRCLDIVESDVLLSIIYKAKNDIKDSLNYLKKAIDIVYKYGFIRIISDEGSGIIFVLKKILLSETKKANYDKFKLEFLNELYLATYVQSKRRKGLTSNLDNIKIKLSKQQKLILGYLAKGYKNSEIIELTGLKITTIKSHTAAAYAKLEVSNVVDAVNKAKKNGLI